MSLIPFHVGVLSHKAIRLFYIILNAFHNGSDCTLKYTSFRTDSTFLYIFRYSQYLHIIFSQCKVENSPFCDITFVNTITIVDVLLGNLTDVYNYKFPHNASIWCWGLNYSMLSFIRHVTTWLISLKSYCICSIMKKSIFWE